MAGAIDRLGFILMSVLIWRMISLSVNELLLLRPEVNKYDDRDRIWRLDYLTIL